MIKWLFDSNCTLFIDDCLEILHSAHTYGIRYLLAVSQPDVSSSTVERGAIQAVDNFASLLSHQS